MTTTVSQAVTEPRPGEDDWSLRETYAETLIPLVGRLFREHGVITAIYGRSLVNKSTRKILKLHRFARHVAGTCHPTSRSRCLIIATEPDLGCRIFGQYSAVNHPTRGRSSSATAVAEWLPSLTIHLSIR